MTDHPLSGPVPGPPERKADPDHPERWNPGRGSERLPDREPDEGIPVGPRHRPHHPEGWFPEDDEGPQPSPPTAVPGKRRKSDQPSPTEGGGVSGLEEVHAALAQAEGLLISGEDSASLGVVLVISKAQQAREIVAAAGEGSGSENIASALAGIGLLIEALEQAASQCQFLAGLLAEYRGATG